MNNFPDSDQMFELFIRRRFNCSLDAGISSTTANIPVHCSLNIGVARIGIAFQQSRRAHYLSGLAVTALSTCCSFPLILRLKIAI